MVKESILDNLTKILFYLTKVEILEYLEDFEDIYDLLLFRHDL